MERPPAMLPSGAHESGLAEPSSLIRQHPNLSAKSTDNVNAKLYQSKLYQYCPLRPGEIRLLKLRLPTSRKSKDSDFLIGEIVHVSLNNKLPKYEALSYVWGTDDSNESMIIGGRRLPIKPNLAAGLRQLRQDFASSNVSQPLWQRHLPRRLRNFRRIWIDAICINQADFHERSSQVQLMRDIYMRCDRLVIWLGPAYADGQLAAKFLEELARIKDDEDSLKLFSTEKLALESFIETYQAILRLLKSPWFRRAWILQEYVLGAKGRALFQYGGHQISQVSMVRSTNFLTRLDLNTWRKEPNIADILKRSEWAILQHQLILQWCKFHFVYCTIYTVLPLQRFPFLHLLVHLRGAASTDPRDMVYATLGMTRLHDDLVETPTHRTSGLIIDYAATVQDVFASVVRELVLKSKRLNVLLACSEGRNPIHRSWAPVWNEDVTRGFLATSCGDYDIVHLDDPTEFWASGQIDCVASFSDSLSILTVRGIDWTIVRSISPTYRPSPSYTSQSSGSVVYFEDPFLQFCHLCWTTLRACSASGSDVDAFKVLWRTLLVNERGGYHDKFCTSLVSPTDMTVQAGDLDEYNGRGLLPFNSILEKLQALFQLTTTWSHPALLPALKEAFGSPDWIFTTERGSVGKFFNTDIQVGDVATIVLGCAAPILLRPIGTQFQVLGGVYVDGIMFGEAMEALERGEVELRDFELI